MDELVIVEIKTKGNGHEFYGQTKSGELLPGSSGYPDANNDICLMRVWPVVRGEIEGIEVTVWGLDEIEAMFPKDARWFVEVGTPMTGNPARGETWRCWNAGACQIIALATPGRPPAEARLLVAGQDEATLERVSVFVVGDDFSEAWIVASGDSVELGGERRVVYQSPGGEVWAREVSNFLGPHNGSPRFIRQAGSDDN